MGFMKNVIVVGYPPVQLLDVSGPFEAFSNVPGYHVQLGTPGSGDQLQTSRAMALTGAKPTSELVGPIDTLIIAGGPGAETGLYDEEFVSWLQDAAGQSRRVASICTGAFLLAAAGLLDGRKAVTHWKFCDRLAKEFPKVYVDADPIYLKDGSIYTSAGITGGIDLSLALIEEDHGHRAALEVARFLVMFLVRPGGQSQYSHMLSHQAVTSKPLRELQVWMLENLKSDLSVEQLAERIGMSPRNFTRVCLRETKMNPGQFVDRMRVEAAQQTIDSSSMGLKEVAAATGFGSADSMSRAFLRVIGVTASEYTSRFKRA